MRTKAPVIKIFFLSFFIMFYSLNTATAEELRMLVWEGYTPPELCEKFKKLVKEKYNVDLTLDIKYVAGNDDFFPALKNKTADIISPSHNVPRDKRWNLIKLKMVLPLNLKNIPNYKNIIPALQNADYCTESNNVYAVPHVRGPYGLAYNTSLVKEAPTTWNVFWDPQYKDKYAIGGSNQYEHNVSMTALAMGISPENIYDYKSLNTSEFQKKLSLLAANAHGMWVGVDDAKTLKGLSLAAVWGFSLPELKNMGETWKIAEPKEGTTGWVDNFMISSALKDKPKLKQIAEEWLNFVLSDDYQTYDVRGLACAPVTTTVKNKLTPEEISQFHLNDPAHFQKNRILWKVLSKQGRKGLERLWTNAIKKQK